MRAHHHQAGASHATQAKLVLRNVLMAAAIAACSATAQAVAIITVNSLADDVFPDAAGAIAVPLTAPKCTLRMAIASANLDLPVGGAAFGCAASTTPTVTTYVTAGSDVINFDPALANGTIQLDATQAMNVGAFTNNISSILFITGPLAIDALSVTRITIDGGSTSATPTKRILAIAEVVPSAAESRAGSSIWVSLLNLNFQNARVESAGACVLSFENIRLFDVSFTNCVSTNTPAVATGGGGALFVRAADNNALTFRPDVRLTRVTFRGNKALAGGSTTNPGGGAFFLGSSNGRLGHVVLSGVTVGGPTAVDQNYADGGYGGGSIFRAESVSVSNSNFQGNVALNGEVGGLRIDSMSGEGAATVFNSSFTANSASNGGALSITNNTASPVIARNLTIDGNTSRGNTGLNMRGNRSIVLSNSNISNNIATASNAGMTLENTTGNVEIDDVIISGNRVLNGSHGGIFIGSNTGAVVIRRASIINNEARKGTNTYASGGAGRFQNNTSVVMTDSTVSGNSSDYHIGALGLDASFSPVDNATGLPVAVLPPTTNSITLDRVTISGNATTGAAAGGSGFAMNYSSSPGLYSILNSTISGNVVSGYSAAFSFNSFNPSSQTNAVRVMIRNSTIARNTAGGAEVMNFGSYNGANPSSQNPFNGSLVIESSVLGGRQSTSNPTSLFGAPNGFAATISNTLIENNGENFSAQCVLGGIICNTDAKLESLANNGGPTKTLRLLPGSPAINSGSNVTGQATDQRGAARPQGPGNDMGAYQTPAGSLTNCSLDMDGDNLVQANKEGLVLVRAMLGFSNANAVVGTGISQPQWAAVKANLNANCGASFP